MSQIKIFLNRNGFLNISENQAYNGSIKLTIDPDALNYIQRVGITNRNIQTNINNFIVGLKNLNLWKNTINVYLLNSGYNSINSTTIYGLRVGYDGNLINSGQATWTSSGIFLRSGYAGTSAAESSGKAVISHPVLPVFDANCTISMLGKTDKISYGSWWTQSTRSTSDRSIWLQPNAYYYSNEVGYGGQYGQAGGNITYINAPRLNTADQYNVISYDVNYVSKTIDSGSGFLNIYKDGVIQATTSTGSLLLPKYCYTGGAGGPYYPCDMHTGTINGYIDLQPDGKMLGTKSQGYYSFAGAFSKVLSSGEHLALKNLVLSTIAQNISLG